MRDAEDVMEALPEPVDDLVVEPEPDPELVLVTKPDVERVAVAVALADTVWLVLEVITVVVSCPTVQCLACFVQVVINPVEVDK